MSASPKQDFNNSDESRESRRCEASFAQERLWFLSKYDETESVAYNSSFALEFKGYLKRHALQAALDRIYERHDVIRTVFEEEDGRPFQLITPIRPFPLEFVTLSSVAPDQIDDEVQQSIQSFIGTPFDLTRGPLAKAIVIGLGDRRSILAVSMHHIITDGWSVQIFTKELLEFYTAYAIGIEPSIQSLPTQYTEYARWQRRELRGEKLLRKLAYWREHLKAPRPTLDLPSDYPRPMKTTSNGTSESFSIHSNMKERLVALGREQHATLFMVLMAAFYTVLHRYSNESDLVVGTPVANRQRVEYEQAMGLFVNTLAVRTDVQDDPSIRVLIDRVLDATIDSLENQDLPFELLVAELAPERDLSRNPLFQVMFALQNVPRTLLESPGLTVDRYRIRSAGAKFDLTLFVSDDPDGMRGSFEFNTDLFNLETIKQLITHFKALLKSALEIPDEPISNLPMLSNVERQYLISGVNQTARAYDRRICLHEIIEQQAARTPHRTAVEDESGPITYAELENRSDGVACFLSEKGVIPGDRVGICLDRSCSLIYGLLGILKTGAAYVPIDPEYPVQRITQMVEDARLKLILTSAQHCDLFKEHDVEVELLDEGVLDRDSDEDALPVETSSDSTAYIIYTSGSTGRPKGVAVSHRSLVNFLCSMRDEPGFGEDESILNITTTSFDIAGVELFLPLISGGRTIVLSTIQAGDANLISAALDRYDVSVLQATPATWQLLIDSRWRGKSGLRMFSAGEALPRRLATLLLERGGELWNMYGPTETTVYSSIEKIDRGDEAISIGRPIANTQTYVLDAHLQPVPLGVEGDLYIGGDGLAQGYFENDEMTSEAFISNPFGPGRIYRTGDRARRLRDGRLICLGRDDHQVKLRGYRIELGDVEHTIASHDMVQNCIADLREDSAGQKSIVAYVTAEDRPEIEALLQYARARLPVYMVPSHLVFLDDYPLTPSGKIDRQTLPEPDETRPDLQNAFIPPRTTTEQTLAAIWLEVLDVERVGIDDNFFDVGGHSLTAIRIHSRIAEKFGTAVSVSLRDLFEYQTISQLAQFLDFS